MAIHSRPRPSMSRPNDNVKIYHFLCVLLSADRVEEAERLQELRQQLEDDQGRLLEAAEELARREADLE